MKKVLLVLAVIFCFANVSTAAVQIGKQANNPSGKFSSPKSVGVRVGYGAEMSYQHYLGKNFLELDLGLIGLDPNIHAIAVYNFTCIEWGSRGRWHLYAGPGLGCGYGKHFKGYDEFISELKLTQDDDRHYGLNLLNVNNGKNTIEFRMANGTLNPEVIKQNVFLYGSLINTAIQMTENPQEFEEKLETFYPNHLMLPLLLVEGKENMYL